MYVKHLYKNDMIHYSFRVFMGKYSNFERQIESKSPQSESDTKDNNLIRRKEKKVLLLCSYLGQNYNGSLFQPQDDSNSTSHPTIQWELMKALHKVGAILDIDLVNRKKTKFGTGSRTDKGVSALTQVASLTMDVSRDYLESLNAALPADIRVWLIQRTMKNFRPRRMCSLREYAYLCPTYAFAPENTDHLEFRIQPGTQLALQELIASYKGLHNFYNFTKGYKHDDPKVNKKILDVSIEDIFVPNKMEFVLLRVKGEAFLYHQIRKMVGLVISVMRGKYPKSKFDQTLSSEKVHLPIAPGLGLVLMHQAFPEYNKKLSKLGLQNKYPSFDVDPAYPKIQQFKNEVIFRHIIEREVNEFSMQEWVNSYLENHDFEKTRN